MGWFEIDDGLALGDVALDELKGAVDRVVAEYHEALERPPTLAELGASLRAVLLAMSGDDVSDLEAADVVAVSFKTKKRPAKQRWGTGDVFAVPLPDGTFGFGRILWRRQPNKGAAVVEVFSHRSAVPVFNPEVLDKGRLLPPMRLAGATVFLEGHWPILDRDPEFRAPDHDTLRLYMWKGDAERNRFDLFDIDFQAVARDVSRAEIPEGAIDRDLYAADPRPEKPAKDIQDALDEAGIEVPGR